MYLPAASVKVVAVDAPVSATVTAVAPVMVPERLPLAAIVLVKFALAMLAPFSVTCRFDGLNVKPDFAGVTV